MRCAVSSFGFQPPAFKSLREMVANSLRQSILDGDLKPGQRLMDAEIASRMGISRSPVREALRQLEKDGLVCSSANRGCTVIELSMEDLFQLYGIRASLEGLAAAWACHTIQVDQLAELKRLCGEMQALLPFQSDADRVAFLHRDAEFHQAMIDSASSPRLAETLAGVRLQIRMMMAAIMSAARASAQAASEHELLIVALESGDTNLAERLARQHVEGARERMLLLLSRTPA
jgi:DNA-binding GntR family transcriptional regulator